MRKGWEYKKLGEVCDVINGYAFKSSKYTSQGTRIIRITNVQKGYVVDNDPKFYSDEDFKDLFQYSLFEGDLVMSLTGNVGRVGILQKNMLPAALNQRVACLRVKSKKMQLNYLFHLLNSNLFENAAIQSARGIAQLNMSTEWLKNYIIPLPPLSTQLAIVSELDKINELIRLKKEQLKDFDNLAQSLFYEMFGDPVENEKGWEVKKLKDISREIGDGLHGTPEYSEVDTGCYFINGNNLENGTIVIKENTKMVSEKTKTKHYIEMDDFTILVSINGTLGKVAFYNGENVILGKSACYIKLEAYNDKKYIFELLKSDYFKRCAENECTGTTIRNVSLKSMRNFRCPLPPLPLQRLFAQRIEQIEREKSEVQKSIQDLETLLASRMQYWFE